MVNLPLLDMSQDSPLIGLNGMVVTYDSLSYFNRAVNAVIEFKHNTQLLEHTYRRDYIKAQLSNQPINWDICPTFSIPHIVSDLDDAVKGLIANTTTNYYNGLLSLLAQMLVPLCGKVILKVNENYFEHLVLYLFLMAEAGMRKSLSVSRLNALHSDNNNPLLNDNVEMRRKIISAKLQKESKRCIEELLNDAWEGNYETNSWAAMSKEIGDIIAKQDEITKNLSAKAKNLFIDSCTGSGFIKMHANADALVSLSAEGDFISEILKDSTLSDYLKKAYNGEAISRTTSRGVLSVEKPCIQILQYTQPSEAIKLLSKESLVNQGLTGRCTFLINNQTWTNQEAYFNINLIRQKLSELSSQVSELSESNQVNIVQVDDIAASRLAEFEQQVKNQLSFFPSKALPTLRKLHGLAARFALAYHLWVEKNPFVKKVSVESVEVGIMIATSLLPSINYCYDDYGLMAEPIAQLIISDLLGIDSELRYRIENEGITISELARRIHKTTAQTEKGVFYLKARKALTVLDVGNSSKLVVLHQNFYNYFAPPYPQLF